MIQHTILKLSAKVFLVTFLSLAAFYLSTATVSAQTSGLNGWAWSSTIGWISMSCENTSTCGNSNYGVSIDSNRNLVGYAWSSNIGWIKFGGLGGFPTATGNPHGNAQIVESGGTTQLQGWARACAGATNVSACSGSVNSTSGGWDGWISFQGTATNGSAYSVQFSGPNVVGTGSNHFAWGGNMNVGWIDFSGVVKNEYDIDVQAFSLSGALGTSVPNLDSTYDNVLFSTSIEGIPEGRIVDYTLQVTGATTYNVLGKVSRSDGVNIFDPPLKVDWVSFGLNNFRLEIDLPAPGAVSETEETLNNFAVLANQEFLPVEPTTFSLTPEDLFVRSGRTTSFTWKIEAPYAATCSVAGAGIDESPIVVTPGMLTTGSAVTRQLNSTSVVILTCTELTTSTDFIRESRVEVVPNVEEI